MQCRGSRQAPASGIQGGRRLLMSGQLSLAPTGNESALRDEISCRSTDRWVLKTRTPQILMRQAGTGG